MFRSRLKGAREPVLERSQSTRWTEVRGLEPAIRAAGQPDEPLLAPFRPGDGRDKNPARRDEAAKRLGRRLDQGMHDHPVEAFARAVEVEPVLPPNRDIGEAEGLDPGRGLDHERLESL